MKSMPLGLVLWISIYGGAEWASAASRPNILWITSEDNGPHLGCYGDGYATTPNLDALAARGMLFRNVWSCAPVCAPARTAIISGLYPSSTGSEHMRSMTRLPKSMRMFPQFLRELGYYCTNNQKEDYNLEQPGQVWDESSARAHYRNRGAGQPFFAVFNHTVTHESHVRKRPHTPVHDPARVPLPAFHPDRPEVRQDWAQYYDKMTEMDALAGRNLLELEEAGLAEETIILYFGDHGPGMPGHKRCASNSGLHVPLIVYVPPKFRHLAPVEYQAGSQSQRLIDFVDLAPTMLSLAGMRPPDWMQGRAFLGPFAATPRRYVFGLRGRMDERYDLVRAVRDERYVYIRNFLPHKIPGQHIGYLFETPSTRVWKQLHDAGQLSAVQDAFWKPKVPEELYDLESDPDEVQNLAEAPDQQKVLRRMRKALHDWQTEIRDVGLLPEAEMHLRLGGDSPYELGHDRKRYAMKPILDMAAVASAMRHEDAPRLSKGLEHRDSAVRYWAVMGLQMRGAEAVAASHAGLIFALEDASWSVRVMAAQALAEHGTPADLKAAMRVLLQAAHMDQQTVYLAMAALNAIDELDQKARPWKPAIEMLPRKVPGTHSRLEEYVPRLIEKTLADLEPRR